MSLICKTEKEYLRQGLLWKPNLTADLLTSSCFLTAIVFKMCNFHIYSFTCFCIYLKEVFIVWFIRELIGRVEDRAIGLRCNRKLYLEKIVRETSSHSNIKCEADAEKKRNKTRSLSKRGKNCCMEKSNLCLISSITSLWDLNKLKQTIEIVLLKVAPSAEWGW